MGMRGTAMGVRAGICSYPLITHRRRQMSDLEGIKTVLKELEKLHVTLLAALCTKEKCR